MLFLYGEGIDLMKKSFLGYNISEVNVMLSALREENESLNATITTLKTQMKNGINGNGAKLNLLEDDLKKSEEELKKVSEEKEELISKITSLTNEVDVLKQQNTEIIAQTKQLHRQNILQTQLAAGKEFQAVTVHMEKIKNRAEESQPLEEELSAVRDELYEDKSATAPLSNKQLDEPFIAALKDYERLNDELRRTRKELESKSAVLDSRNGELAHVKEELSLTKDALASTKTALENTIDQLEKFQQPININKASEITYQAYCEMSRMRNEIVEYMHQQMKEYYQLTNDNNIKMRSVIEQRQQDYSQMIREFFTNASEFRTRLSNVEVECSNVVDFNMNIDQVSMRMKEIMDRFMEECDTSIRNS
ncbi:MAG: hypothetical protein K0R34_3437 [Herbinix sp.]|nr:hypothetical protein [Herbinix sp.]